MKWSMHNWFSVSLMGCLTSLRRNVADIQSHMQAHSHSQNYDWKGGRYTGNPSFDEWAEIIFTKTARKVLGKTLNKVKVNAPQVNFGGLNDATFKCLEITGCSVAVSTPLWFSCSQEGNKCESLWRHSGPRTRSVGSDSCRCDSGKESILLY